MRSLASSSLAGPSPLSTARRCAGSRRQPPQPSSHAARRRGDVRGDEGARTRPLRCIVQVCEHRNLLEQLGLSCRRSTFPPIPLGVRLSSRVADLSCRRALPRTGVQYRRPSVKKTRSRQLRVWAVMPKGLQLRAGLDTSVDQPRAVSIGGRSGFCRGAARSPEGGSPQTLPRNWHSELGFGPKVVPPAMLFATLIRGVPHHPKPVSHEEHGLSGAPRPLLGSDHLA